LDNLDQSSLSSEYITLCEIEGPDIWSSSLPRNLSKKQLSQKTNRSGITFLSEFTKQRSQVKKLYQVYDSTINVVTDTNGCHFYSIETETGKELFGSGLSLNKDLANINSLRNDVVVGDGRGPYQHFDSACFCLEIWSGNYFHWLIFVLPRILYLKTILGDQFPPLLMSDHLEIPLVVETSLDLIGIRKEDCASIHHGKVSVKELYFPVMSRFDRSMLASLRLKLTESFESDLHKSDFIYVSRKKANKRRCSNETEVETCLENFGFTTIHAEAFTFSEQIQIFKNARIVCGLHGAGLSNMLFMADRAQVIEIGNKSDPSPLFYSLANALNLDYWYVEATLGTDSSKDIGNANINVNIGSLRSVLEQAVAAV
jgi:hypothetical protein